MPCAIGFVSVILCFDHTSVNLTLDDLLQVPHVRADGLSAVTVARPFRDVSTDSRSLKRDDLFVALRGESFDGHAYLEQVATEGAMAAIVSEAYVAELPKGHKLPLPVLVVTDTLDAYGALARIYRRKFSIPIMVIAGSNGKTTTKEVLAHVLSGAFGVLKTEANYNNQVGLPKMLFQLRDGHEIAILEIGTNHPGEIAWLANVAEPTHALVTNIGREHLEFFHDLKGVAEEECVALDATVARGGTVFLNMDDRYLRQRRKQYGASALTYGTGSTEEEAAADDRFVHAFPLGFAKDGRLEVRVGCEGKSFTVRTHIIADYASSVVAAAVAVGVHFGMRRAAIRDELQRYRPHSKRLEVIKLPHGITVINDAYNANPDSMLSAMRTLAAFPAEGRKYIALGDMFELGETSHREHRGIGRKAAELGFNHVLFTGADMALAAKAYLAAQAEGQDREVHFASKAELADRLRAELRPGDVLLIKGSRGMRMEEILDLLQRQEGR